MVQKYESHGWQGEICKLSKRSCAYHVSGLTVETVDNLPIIVLVLVDFSECGNIKQHGECDG